MENNCQMVLRKRLSAEERAKQKEEAVNTFLTSLLITNSFL